MATMTTRARKVPSTAMGRLDARTERYKEETPQRGEDAIIGIRRNQKTLRRRLNEIAEQPTGTMCVELYALTQWVMDEGWRVRKQREAATQDGDSIES